MKTMKVMAIIGFALCAFVLILAFMHIYATTYEWADGAIGWGMLLALFAIAQNIVTIVQVNKQK